MGRGAESGWVVGGVGGGEEEGGRGGAGEGGEVSDGVLLQKKKCRVSVFGKVRVGRKGRFTPGVLRR